MYTPTSYCSAALLAALLFAFARPETSAFTPPHRGSISTTCRGNSDVAIRSSSSVDESAAPAIADVPTAADAKEGKKKRVAILLCPAQFCVPADYSELLDDIRTERAAAASDAVEVVAARVAPLPRTEWIKVARQLPTREFLDAELSAKVTLDWYFEAIEQGLADLFAEAGGEEDVEVCLIGHSIGGWVARAYLGGLGGSSTAVYRLAREKITSLVTLGTPHASPESALVDQTRGLLREVASSPRCSSQSLVDEGIKITCVGSTGLAGKLITSDVEEIIAATSYLPLVGKLGPDVRGDGIVPAELAFMESPAQRVEIERCNETGSAVRHAHVLPTPWNLIDGGAPSWKLPEDIVWYGSPGVLGQWSEYVG